MAIDIYDRSGQLVGQSAMIDAIPTDESENVVESGGVYSFVQDEPDKSIATAVTNLIDKSKVVPGTINTTTGEISTSSTYHVTDFIDVDTNEVYLSPNCDKMGAYGNNRQFISVVNVSPDTIYDSGAVSFPTGTKYVRLRIIENGVDNAIFVQAKYYNKNANPQTLYAGFSDNFTDAFQKGFGDYISEEKSRYSVGKNMFDYEHDFFQVAAGIVNGIDQNTGVFIYRYNIITSNTEITNDFCVAMDKYYPISYGQMIVSNYSLCVAAFYATDKSVISIHYVDSSRPYQGIAAPQNSAYVRVSFRGNPSIDGSLHSLEDIKSIVLWTTNVIGSNDYVPSVQSPQPHTLIDGNAVSPNYLDKVLPSMAESEFLSAMRCMTIREINKRDHAWRFGNFNMWIMAGLKGWNMTKKMLMDYGVDFCGFEECVINESTSRHKGIAEFLHGWQFPSGYYENWTDGAEQQIDKSFTSRFDVISSQKLWFTSASSNASYLNCKVRLPRYMDVYNPVRILSVYVVHFAIAQSPDKIEIATELLQQISTDTSDFVVILGDTNDFGATDETKDYWVTLEAGGFRPVLPITSKTVTEDGLTDQSDPQKPWRTHAIDQFLISDNIDVVSYGVINTKDEYAVNGVSGAGTDNEPALSDHDFVYCDLKFNYDTPRTVVPVPNS